MRTRASADGLLGQLYPQLEPLERRQLLERCFDAAGITANEGQPDSPASDSPAPAASAGSNLPGQDEVVLITYANTLLGPADGSHLATLNQFCDDQLAGVFSTVHVLPFYPASSDGGFAVIDYRQVAEDLGGWPELTELGSGGSLMVDLVCNHGSAHSEWFAQFQADELPGRDYYKTASPDDDLSLVTRPRTHPLLRPTETAGGQRHVWATFSHDQVDFDFSNPAVLVEFCSILGFYLDQGADRIRLDAIAYLWKQIGTTCIHLPQTHQVVKLMRLVVEARNPSALIITETNVPHAENVSYFGDSDEAHVVYNFTLAPLIVWSLLTGDANTITGWLGELAPPPPGSTFLNFLASHDGLGLRPVEDLISPIDLAPMMDAALKVGGAYSAYASPSGPRPYELNVSLADLLAGPSGETAERFVTAHALMMAVQGIPAIYMHSMLASPGDLEAVAATGANRSINRSRIPAEEAISAVSSGWRGDVFDRLKRLIRLRRSLEAFAPQAAQRVHDADEHVVMIERGSGATTVVAVHNMSEDPVSVELPASFQPNGGAGVPVDLIADEPVSAAGCALGPWQSRWIRLARDQT